MRPFLPALALAALPSAAAAQSPVPHLPGEDGTLPQPYVALVNT